MIEETVIKANDMNIALDPVDDILKKFERVVSSVHAHKPQKTMRDILHKTLEGIEKKTKAPQGWCYELNKITKGFNPTDLVVYAGRPSMGKTALALCDFNHLTMTENIPSLLLSLEMGDTQITSRLLAINTGIELEKILSNNLSKENWKMLTDTAAIMSKAPMFMDDRGGISIYEVGASIRRHHKENKIQVVFIDYLQLILTKTKSDNRNNEVAFITSYLKGLAKELGICVVVLSQLNREVETRKDKRPMLSDLRDSGAIEQDADIVIFPFRPSWYDNSQEPDELIIAKHRNGALGKVKVLYQGFLTRFVNLSSR
jgi:replicative DNA helicase